MRYVSFSGMDGLGKVPLPYKVMVLLAVVVNYNINLERYYSWSS